MRTGYAGNVFCWVFDRRNGTFIEDSSRVLPTPAVEVSEYVRNVGRMARYRALVEGYEVTRDRESWRVEGNVGDVRIDLTIRERGTPITAICPSDATVKHALNVTRKQADATASGKIRAGTHTFELGDDHGFIDYSHGVLGRETVWQWAIGAGETESGRRIAFNLVASFNDGLENVLWIDGEPRAVGHATFEMPEDRRDRWRVTADSIDLTLDTEAVRAQELDLGVVVSDYAQPLGVWRGEIDGESFEGRGVAEDHRSVW